MMVFGVSPPSRTAQSSWQAEIHAAARPYTVLHTSDSQRS